MFVNSQNMISNYITLILNFFHKIKNDTLWRNIKDSKIIRKEYWSLGPNICEKEHLLNKWTAAASDDLQKEYNGDLTFPNLKSILFRYSTLFKILYWDTRSFVFMVLLRKVNFSPVYACHTERKSRNRIEK